MRLPATPAHLSSDHLREGLAHLGLGLSLQLAWGLPLWQWAGGRV